MSQVFRLPDGGHGGSRTHLSTATPFSQQSGGIFPESCPLILFRITGRRIKPRADGRPLLTVESAVSRSHKPRPPKFKLPGLPRAIALGAGTRCPRSATTYTVGAGSTAGGANFARPLRRFAAAVVVGLKDGFHPLSAASCGSRKELTSLSSHAFVRSMTWAWCHSRHLPEKLALSTKAFIIITLIIKKCNNILE